MAKQSATTKAGSTNEAESAERSLFGGSQRHIHELGPETYALAKQLLALLKTQAQATNRLERKVDQLMDNITAAKESVENLKKEVQENNALIDELQDNVTTAATKIEELTAKVAALEVSQAERDALNTALGEIKTEIDAAATAIDARQTKTPPPPDPGGGGGTPVEEPGFSPRRR